MTSKWKRPRIVPFLKDSTTENFIKITEGWKINTDLSAYPADGIEFDSWQDVIVPGRLANQGIYPKQNKPYFYYNMVDVPLAFKGKVLKLRFEGANCYTKVYVNGRYVRDHYGGFTTWECDIAGFVVAGESAQIVVEITDKNFEMSQFHSGGLIRDVYIIAKPCVHFTRLHADTVFDSDYLNAKLNIYSELNDYKDGLKTKLELYSPTGDMIFSNWTDPSDKINTYNVESPIKWDSEHPNLYTIKAELYDNAELVERTEKYIGFRQIDIVGNRMFVNGDEVKLRGVNREEIFPLTGRTITHDIVEETIRLFKEANVNFIRTSHYPPRDDFLDACDKYGMYVEEESSVSFIGQGQQYVQHDPNSIHKFMGQYSEMVERDRSHPCVIMWSHGNECVWGEAFRQQEEYIKAEDTSRPTIFSYPLTMLDEDIYTDVWSVHYQEVGQDPSVMTGSRGRELVYKRPMPVIHDEYVHVPCYNLAELKRDQGVRGFWGESINRFWDDIYNTSGALGGAIWGGIDEVSMTPAVQESSFEWGIIDGFRRKKPEHYETKKGYSPIYIDNAMPEYRDGNYIVNVQNRYNHTNLSELKIEYICGKYKGDVIGFELSMGETGEFTVPADMNAKKLYLKFIEASGMVSDIYALPLELVNKTLPEFTSSAPFVTNDSDYIVVSGNDFEIKFSKTDGLIKQGIYDGKLIIKDGPYILLTRLTLGDWQLSNIDYNIQDAYALVMIAGTYDGGKVKVRFNIKIDAAGLMETQYIIDDLYYPNPPRTWRSRLDVAGFTELGVSYVLSSEMEKLAWDRNGRWSIYPDYHYGGNAGSAVKTTDKDNLYMQLPPHEYSMDMRNSSLFGMYDFGMRGTRSFRSQKFDINSADITGTDNKGIKVLSDGTHSVRLEVLPPKSALVFCDDESIKYSGSWQRLADKYCKYGDCEMISNTKGDCLEYEFDGTGISFIGASHVIYSTSDIYIDGKKIAGIDQYNKLLRVRGREKTQSNIQFTIEDLPKGRHTIKTVVTGDAGDISSPTGVHENSYVGIEAFWVMNGDTAQEVKLNINNEYNYPNLSWGCYMKPAVLIENGYTNSAFMKFKK